MTGFTVTGRVAPTDEARWDAPLGTAILTDGTLLVAAPILGGGTITVRVWHLAADLSTIADADLAAEGVAVLVGRPDGGALLVALNGSTFTPYIVATDGAMTFTPRATLPTAIPAITSGTNLPQPVIGPDGNVHIFRQEWHHVISTDGAQVSAGAIPVDAITAHPSGLMVAAVVGGLQAWDYITHTPVGPILPYGWWALGGTDPSLDQWAYATTDNDTGRGTDVRDGQTGDILAQYGPGQYRETAGATAPDGMGGFVGIAFTNNDTDEKSVAALDHVTPTGAFTHTEHALQALSGLARNNGQESISCAGGQWVAATIHLISGHTGTAVYRLNVWAGTVPMHGLLTVDTLDVPWWVVGTRDPGMAYELLVDTPLGWKVEIVAGEEHLATDELCVYDPMHEEAGDDGWVVCALFRPE